MNSSPLDVQALAARIEKLEAANRRWKSACAIALLFVVSMLLLSTKHAERAAAAAKPDRIEQDVLKDADGHVHARFGLNSIPEEKLLKAPNGLNSPNARVYVVPPDGAMPGQATLQFYDGNGHTVWTAPSKPQFMTVR